MKIALTSEKFINKNVEFNIKQILKTIQKAHDKDVDMLLFGESFLQGFDSLSFDYSKDCHVACELFSYGIKFIRWMCARYQIGCGFGYFELSKQKIYSSYLIVGQNGEIIYNYRRRSEGWKELFVKDEKYDEGNSFDTFTFLDVTFSVALCGDLWNDNLLNEMGKVKADVLSWPVYVNFDKKRWQEEKNFYCERVKNMKKTVLLINSLSDDPYSSGGSFVFKDNQILLEGKLEKSDLLIFEFVK